MLKNNLDLLHKILLKLTAWVEERTKLRPRQKLKLLQREVRVSTPIVVTVLTVVFFWIILSETGLEWQRITASILFIGFLLSFFAFYLYRYSPSVVANNDQIALLGLVTVLFVLLMSILNDFPSLSPYLFPTGAAAMLVTILLKPQLAVIISLVIALFIALFSSFNFNYFFFSLFSGLVGVVSVVNVRHRHDIIQAGIKISAINAYLLVVLKLFQGWPNDILLSNLGWAAANGILSAVIVLITLPFLENIFSITTDIKLLELADFNQPLLKQLMMTAPGTYHHSLIVSSLAESAAEAIGANTLLCRVGAYYHDIGKIVNPNYFIENQRALNIHDNLTPSMSSLIVVSHIKEGVAMARQHNLDQTIIDFISMHHGTSRIHYFYQRALEHAGEEKVDEENYRYPGPRPQTKETAIVMLADACEAASRTLENPTPGRIGDLVAKIVNNKFIDRQFDQCSITLADLHRIAESLTHSLSGIYHARIEYPEEKPAGSG